MSHTRTITALAAVLATLGAGLIAGPAVADTGYVGRVEAHGGLVAHYVPSSRAPRYGSYADGTRLNLTCKVHADAVRGNDLWYLVGGSKTHWVSARYVANVGTAPRYCGDAQTSTGRVKVDRLNMRMAPTLRAAKVGVLKRHDRIHAECWVDGLGQGAGDVQWYQLTNGKWVSAAYIGPTSPRVELCR